MKLIELEYLEESTKAIFFNIKFKNNNFFGISKIKTKRAILDKWNLEYANNFKLADNTGYSIYDSAIINEMILAYENRNKTSIVINKIDSNKFDILGTVSNI